MYKLIASILLLVLLLPATFKTICVVDYVVRYDYYANELCENKDNEEMQCNGACQLNKNLTAVDQNKDERPSIPDNFKYDLSAFIVPNNDINISWNKWKSNAIFSYNNLYESIFSDNPSLPPCL